MSVPTDEVRCPRYWVMFTVNTVIFVGRTRGRSAGLRQVDVSPRPYPQAPRRGIRPRRSSFTGPRLQAGRGVSRLCRSRSAARSLIRDRVRAGIRSRNSRTRSCSRRRRGAEALQAIRSWGRELSESTPPPSHRRVDAWRILVVIDEFQVLLNTNLTTSARCARGLAHADSPKAAPLAYTSCWVPVILVDRSRRHDHQYFSGCCRSASCCPPTRLTPWLGSGGRKPDLPARQASLCLRPGGLLHDGDRRRVSRPRQRRHADDRVPISIVGGAGNGIQWIAVMTALQERTPAEYQARHQRPHGIARRGMPGVGYLLGGGSSPSPPLRTAYAVAGVGLLVLILARAPVPLPPRRAAAAFRSALRTAATARRTPRCRAGVTPAHGDGQRAPPERERAPPRPPPLPEAPSGGA